MRCGLVEDALDDVEAVGAAIEREFRLGAAFARQRGHAFGIDILDGVFNDLSDIEGFRRECQQGREMGFDGKTRIHPSQIEPCNAVFSPGDAEVAQARRFIAVFDLPENRDKGIVQIDGRMVERLHADMARRTVAIAKAIAARGA